MAKKKRTIQESIAHELRLTVDQELSDREAVKIISSMASSLRIIATWAACDSSSPQTRQRAMADINAMAMKGLGQTRKTNIK